MNETNEPIEVLHAHQLLFLRAISADDREAVYLLDGWDCADYTSGIQLEPPPILSRREAVPRIPAGGRRAFTWDGWLYRARPGEGCSDRVTPPAGETTIVACTGEDWRAEQTRCTAVRLDQAAGSEAVVVTFSPEAAPAPASCAALEPSSSARAGATVRDLDAEVSAVCPQLPWECVDARPSATDGAEREGRDDCHIVLHPDEGFVRITLYASGHEPRELVTDVSGAWLWEASGALRLPNGRTPVTWAPSR